MTYLADYDLAIIGSGPGGYVAAIRAGQLGFKTAVVERADLGGVCLNWGCIPSKSLLRNAEVLNLYKRAEEFGVSFDNFQYDYSVAQERSREVVDKLTNGIASLLRKNKVTHIKAEANLLSSNTINLKPNGDNVDMHSHSDLAVLTADRIVVATGARASSIPGLAIDGNCVITSREALALRSVPERIAIIGGGATGVEFAYLFNAYGSEVTILEALPHLVPTEDEEISTLLERSFSKRGINVLTGSRVKGAKITDNEAKLEVENEGQTIILEADRVLVAVGVSPNVEGLGLESLGIELSDGFIQVDASMATNVRDIYAIGDVTGIMLLAHVASAQGVLAVERMAGMDVPDLNYATMPRATYCNPQVTSYGLTEKQAIEEGHQIKVGKFPLVASGKAMAIGEVEGFTKIVTDEDSEEILGAHMIGPEVTEMLGELSLAMLLEGTSREVGRMVHAHPTLSETIKEAALSVDNEAIHI